jgi:hypothetical protein
VRKLLAVLAIATSAYANDISYYSLQSGWGTFATPLTDRGLHGEGQIIAVLDTGVDFDSCYFAESDNLRPPVNTGTPTGGLQWRNVDPSRRKIIAYDFLYSCDQFPSAKGCENPANLGAYDNTGHGTHNAATAAGDKGARILHDTADSIASGAKLIVQDGGFVGGDNCSQRPGFGCPVNLTPILDQAYKQGARIHTNSWGDRQGAPPFVNPPVANYSQSARDVDAFVFTHPDMLVVFDTGNYGATADIPPTPPPAYSVAAPGTSKNSLQIGGVRPPTRDDSVLSYNTLYGPTRDGRIKPDLVGPATVSAGDGDNNPTTRNCNFSTIGPGTSWSTPTIAAAAALVRQYYTEGFYPTGAATSSNAFTPSAALLKATLIAAARRVPMREVSFTEDVPTQPVPSYEQGFGFPVLDSALYFAGDVARLRAIESAGDATTLRLKVRPGTQFTAVLVWTDPPGVPGTVSDPTPELVNDLDLMVTHPDGTHAYGNERLHPGAPDRLNNVEGITLDDPVAGVYTIDVAAHAITFGSRQPYALVITGDFSDVASPRLRAVRH